MAITIEKYGSNQAITHFINAFTSKDTNTWAVMPVMLRRTAQTLRNCQEAAVCWGISILMHTGYKKKILTPTWHCPLSCFKMFLIKVKDYHTFTRAEGCEQMLTQMHWCNSSLIYYRMQNPQLPLRRTFIWHWATFLEDETKLESSGSHWLQSVLEHKITTTKSLYNLT